MASYRSNDVSGHETAGKLSRRLWVYPVGGVFLEGKNSEFAERGGDSPVAHQPKGCGVTPQSFHDRSISSSVLPFVSGTCENTKKKPKRLNAP